MKQKIQIISAPSILGLKPTGVEQLANVLLNTGRLHKLKYVEPLIEVPTLNAGYNKHRDHKTKCLNPTAIHDFSRILMSYIAEQIDKSNFPLVLGGDCSILIGIMPGLRSKGNFGLIFLDAHADFYEPAKSTTGELADMDLAIVTGRGPDILTDIDNLKPYVEDKNVIQIGQRDAEQTKEYGSQDIRKTGINVFDFATIKSAGLDKVIDDVIKYMDELNLDGFWIHFDTDVISDDENPAVDYRLPGGLTFKEAEHLLNQLVQTGKITGISVTIFNPNLDKSGEIAIKISDCLVFGLSKNSC
ncbi:arginase family protein [Parapedobacter tibetensis]|uniref:arginase family protein n=1 Tax=Parapedobacter tibetensis TaxID=2972951 RepID=UPI00214D6F22|nr:arginase family protein [Parapedobacter tibetensis]